MLLDSEVCRQREEIEERQTARTAENRRNRETSDAVGQTSAGKCGRHRRIGKRSDAVKPPT
jgi:hypothetical protein